MLYFIGGPPRAGKSHLLHEFIKRKPMSSFSCDYLYDMDQVKNIEGFHGADILKKGRLFLPTLKQLLTDISQRSEDCVIEGEVITPEVVYELSKSYDIKSCFIGISQTSLDAIIENGGFFNWPKHKIEDGLGDEVQSLADKTIAKSMVIAAESEKYGLPYVDLSNDYAHQFEQALDILAA